MNSFENPYGEMTGGQWLRGNLHTHTTRSDGKRPAQEVIDDYASRGYDFLMISDHDVFTSAEELSRLAARGMILIPGNEVSAHGSHMLHVNASRRVEPAANRQAVLDEIASDAPALAVVCHPNFLENFDHTSIRQLREWVGYAGIEIYNGVIGRLPGSPYALDKWDQLLSQGWRAWGFAHDDSHAKQHDVGLGWNMVYAQSRSLPAIVDALRQGRFYASTGVFIRRIEVKKNRIRLETDSAERIVAIQQSGQRFATAEGASIEVTVPDDARYVRFECWGRGERFAWSQPFYASGFGG